MSQFFLDLQTLGYAAGLYQQDPRAIEIGLHAIGVLEPQLALNGLRHYRSADVQQAVGWIAKCDAERAASDAADKVIAKELA